MKIGRAVFLCATLSPTPAPTRGRTTVARRLRPVSRAESSKTGARKERAPPVRDSFALSCSDSGQSRRATLSHRSRVLSRIEQGWTPERACSPVRYPFSLSCSDTGQNNRGTAAPPRVPSRIEQGWSPERAGSHRALPFLPLLYRHGAEPPCHERVTRYGV